MNKPPFPPKITAERTKKLNEHEEQQGQQHEQQGKKEQGQAKGGGSKSGGSSGGGGESGGSGGGGGGGGDAVKSALQAIVAFGDDTGYTALDPRLADLLASAKRVLSQQEE